MLISSVTVEMDVCDFWPAWRIHRGAEMKLLCRQKGNCMKKTVDDVAAHSLTIPYRSGDDQYFIPLLQ